MNYVSIADIEGETSFECFKRERCTYIQEPLLEIDILKSRTESLIADNEKLREVILIGEEEFKKNNNRITRLEKEILQLKEILTETESENKTLKEELEKERARARLYANMLYGRSSEKQTPESSTEEDNFEYEESDGGYFVRKIERGARHKHKGHGRKIPENLPVKEETIDLSEDKKKCEICGAPLEDTGLEEVSDEISVEKSYYIRRKKRKIYRKSCNCEHSLVLTPPAPTLIPRSKFSTEFWISCLIDKYLNHLPITRQIFDMKLYGLAVSKGTIFGGLKTIYFLYIEALYLAMQEEIKNSNGLIHADETGWHVFVKIKDKDGYNWYMWVFISGKVILYIPAPTRSSKVPLKVIFDIDEQDIENIAKTKDFKFQQYLKILLVDKYVGYEALLNLGLVLLAYCWAHQRREFVQLATKYPDDQQIITWVNMWIEKVAELYKINNERIKYNQQDPDFAIHNEKLKHALHWMEEEINKEYQHPGQKQIMRSMKEHWEGLTLFVKYPWIAMDNNLIERLIRPMVVGRKNYWGAHSIWGSTLAGAMFSIIQTCILNDISPEAYLKYYLYECIKRGSCPDKNEIVSYLPNKLGEEIKKKLSITKPQIFDDS